MWRSSCAGQFRPASTQHPQTWAANANDTRAARAQSFRRLRCSALKFRSSIQRPPPTYSFHRAGRHQLHATRRGRITRQSRATFRPPPTALEALEGLKPKREKNWTRRQKHKSAYRLSFGQKSPTQSLLDKKTPQSPNAAVPPTRAANATLLQSATSTTLVTRPVKRWTEEVRPLHSVDSKLLHSVTSTTLAIPPPKTWIQRDILPKSSPEIELQQDDTERSHLFQFNGAPDIAELRSLISPGCAGRTTAVPCHLDYVVPGLHLKHLIPRGFLAYPAQG